MHSHALQVTRKVTEVLDRHSVPYTIKEKGKHPHIEFVVDNKAHRVPLHNKRISGGFYDIQPTMRRVERIVTRQEQETDMSATATIVQIHSPSLSIESIRAFDGEPRIDDATLSSVLGYVRGDKTKNGVRQIINRRIEEVESYGPIVAETEHSGQGPGRPTKALYLNEAQALLVTMFSDASSARHVRRRLIETFLEWKRAQQASMSLPAPAAEPEILANDAAIEQITRAVVAAMGIPQASSQVSHQAMGEKPVMAAEVRKMLEDLFYWQRDKLNGIHNEIARRDETIRLMGSALDEQGRRIIDLSDQIETARRTIIGVVATQRQKALVEVPRQVELVLPMPEPEASTEIVAEVVAEVVAEPEATPAPIERVTLQQVYEMIGIDRRRITVDQSLAGFVRMGLTHYHERMKVELVKEVVHHTRSGKPVHINHFSKDLVMAWYEERGRDGLRKHLKKVFKEKTLAGIA